MLWVLGRLASMCQTAEPGGDFNRRIVHLTIWGLQSRPLEIVFCRVGYSPRPLARLIGGRTVLWLSLHMGRVAERMVMLLCRAECEDALKKRLFFHHASECFTAVFDTEARRARTLRQVAWVFP